MKRVWRDCLPIRIGGLTIRRLVHEDFADLSDDENKFIFTAGEIEDRPDHSRS